MELTEKEKKAAKAFARLGGLKGGKARAAALSPEERQEIARHAAEKRWGNVRTSMPEETHTGVLKIGDKEIPCAVLYVAGGRIENGLRVLSSAGVSRTMGSRKKGVNVRTNHENSTSPQLPPFLAAANLQPFISNELMTPLMSPIRYKPKRGGIAFGYEATLLPQICEVILDAYKAGALVPRQRYLVDTAEILMRGFARVGIIALIDEATGYQDVRDRLALQAILDKFLRKDWAKWAKRFPDEFYQQIFRLRNWQWRGMRVNRPQIVAHYTKDLIYARLAPGVLNELEVRNPKNEKGYRKTKFTQWLTDDLGIPALERHLYSVVGFMRVAQTWDELLEMLDKAYPRCKDTLQLALFQEDEFPAN